MTSNEKGNALAGMGTPTRAMGNGLATTFPYPDHNTATREKLLISDLLHTGSKNGITLTELVQLTGEDERSIRRRIQRERKSGKLILSDNQSGYFLPGTEDEVKRFIRSMSRRAREISVVACAAEDVLARMIGQESLEGWHNG